LKLTCTLEFTAFQNKNIKAMQNKKRLNSKPSFTFLPLLLHSELKISHVRLEQNSILIKTALMVSAFS
jgi:hypothetical protein